MKRPGTLPRQQASHFNASISESFVARLTICEDDHRRTVSHTQKMCIVIRSHGIGDFHEALLSRGPVGESIADQQRPETPDYCVSSALRHGRVIEPWQGRARIHHHEEERRQSIALAEAAGEPSRQGNARP
jgi:hypothetical protein